MKQNTKFLWMYIGILFSFALILIIFAGFSRNTDTEQAKGLKSDVAQLSRVNTDLKAENKNLRQKVEELTAYSDACGVEKSAFDTLEQIFEDAYDLYIRGDKKSARELVGSLDEETFSSSQKILYDIINR